MASDYDARAPDVVENSLRVHGIPHLRICNASNFRQIITCHLQTLVVMVVDKCIGMITAQGSQG